MRKLDRDLVVPPACLKNYSHLIEKWDSLNSVCRKELRQAVMGMQRSPVTGVVLCAYCEGAIHNEIGHIEHFRPKGFTSFPELTFEWTNLFFSCESSKHCGHYKDRPGAEAYSFDYLIKPDEVDPEKYLYFHSSGEVRERAGLYSDQTRIASETIRVFGLNSASLRDSRFKALSAYQKIISEDLDEISMWSEEDRNSYLQEEIEATRWDPYATTIKHFLSKS